MKLLKYSSACLILSLMLILIYSFADEVEGRTKEKAEGLINLELKNQVNEVVTSTSNSQFRPEKCTDELAQTEGYQKIESLGMEAIPYLLQNIQESEEDEDKKFFILYSINEMLGFHVMVGNWESSYRVNCEYEMYTAEWYAFQLQSYLNDETTEITDMQKKTGFDIYADYDDTVLMNKVKSTIDEMTVHYNMFLSGPPSIEENKDSYEKIVALGEEAIPYLLRYVSDEEMKEQGSGCRAKEWFVMSCAYDIYEKLHGEMSFEYRYGIDKYYVPGDVRTHTHTLMSYIKDNMEKSEK